MKRLPLIITLLVTCFFAPSYYAQAATGNISVILGSNLTCSAISGTGMIFDDSSGKNIHMSGTFNVTLNADKFLKVASNSFKMPLKIRAEQPISVNGVKYYGTILFKDMPRSFIIVNIIDIELYLRGVIKAEMDVKWPMEALKTQTVLARTYAVSSGGKHGEYDVCSSSHCQVYKGTAAENSRADETIRATSGEILNWQGRPASVFYHSDSGGMITASKNVWGGDISYLQPRVEPIEYNGPHTKWQTTVPMSFIELKIKQAGITIGRIQSITPIKRDSSGRILSLEIQGEKGNKTISGYKFRSIVGADKIKSTLFEIGLRSHYVLELQKQDQSPSKTESQTPPLKIDLSAMPEKDEDKIVWMTKNKLFTTLELMEMLSKPENMDLYIKTGIARSEGKLPIPALTNDPDTEKNIDIPDINSSYTPSNLSMAAGTGSSITFYGRGWGHGVGLSQWGAKTLAENGWDYKRILEHYFPGTTIGQ